MATYALPFLCLWCERFEPLSETEGCEPFPDGIPDEVFENRWDHRQPIPGDGGLLFEPNEGYAHSVDYINGFLADAKNPG